MRLCLGFSESEEKAGTGSLSLETFYMRSVNIGGLGNLLYSSYSLNVIIHNSCFLFKELLYSCKLATLPSF